MTMNVIAGTNFDDVRFYREAQKGYSYDSVAKVLWWPSSH
jgi:hypothetical protein